jgi:hypothetical protein
MFHADDVPQGHRKGGMFYYFLNTDRTIMNNPYNIQATPIREVIEKQLPYGLETTADMLLEFMSKSDDEHLRDIATFMKASKKLHEMKALFNFAMSLLQQEIVPIQETIYDTGLDGIKELKDHLADKYGKDNNMKVNAKASNFINWLILKLPLKNELKHYRLIY